MKQKGLKSSHFKATKEKLQSKVDDLESAMRLLKQSADDAKEKARKASVELNDARRQSEIQQAPAAIKK